MSYYVLNDPTKNNNDQGKVSEDADIDIYCSSLHMLLPSFSDSVISSLKCLYYGNMS